MALSDITDYIKTTLQGVSGIGLVYTYEPIVVQAGDIPATIGASQSVHYWTIKRIATGEMRLTNVETERHHTIAVRGYREVGTASSTEATFQTLVESIMSTFRGTYQVPTATGTQAEVFGPMQVEEVGHLRLAETFLVHFADLRIMAQERVQP